MDSEMMLTFLGQLYVAFHATWGLITILLITSKLPWKQILLHSQMNQVYLPVICNTNSSVTFLTKSLSFDHIKAYDINLHLSNFIKVLNLVHYMHQVMMTSS